MFCGAKPTQARLVLRAGTFRRAVRGFGLQARKRIYGDATHSTHLVPFSASFIAHRLPLAAGEFQAARPTAAAAGVAE